MKATVLLAVAVAALACAPKAEKGEDRLPQKDITLQLYSLRDDIKKDYAGTITQVGEMGYTSVEAAGYADGKFYGRTPAEFKADLEKAGLYLLSSHTGRGLSADELKAGKASDNTWAWWRECIAAHKEAGATYIATAWMDVPKTLADLQTYCEYYNAIGRMCKDNGLMYGYHNHAHEFTKVEGETMYDYMLQHTDPSLVFFEMDVYWVVRGQNSPVDYINQYPGRFALLHIKDNKELGQSGMVGFDAIFKNTDTAGTKHLVVEVEQYNHAPAESVKMSLDYLLACPLVKAKY